MKEETIADLALMAVIGVFVIAVLSIPLIAIYGSGFVQQRAVTDCILSTMNGNCYQQVYGGK